MKIVLTIGALVGISVVTIWGFLWLYGHMRKTKDEEKKPRRWKLTEPTGLDSADGP